MEFVVRRVFDLVFIVVLRWTHTRFSCFLVFFGLRITCICFCLQTFLELIDLAKRGDPSKVNLCGSDLKSDSDQSDMYSTFVSNIADMAISNFGQALIDPQGQWKVNLL